MRVTVYERGLPVTRNSVLRMCRFHRIENIMVGMVRQRRWRRGRRDHRRKVKLKLPLVLMMEALSYFLCIRPEGDLRSIPCIPSLPMELSLAFRVLTHIYLPCPKTRSCLCIAVRQGRRATWKRVSQIPHS